jgi:pilus assembly protein CpaE
MASPDQIRLLLVEDVPQVAQYVRDLLNTQASVKLLDVLSDGAKAVGQVAQLRPDVVLVDALLQGKVKGPQLVEQIRQSGLDIPAIVITVPQQSVDVSPARGIHGVLTMPFSGFELMTLIHQVMSDQLGGGNGTRGRVVSVFSPKGGVGKTTLALNLACALGQLGRRTVLIDGCLQFGDLRTLLKVPPDAPSILDLPTDRIAESDLQDVLWRDPSGIDILLAPPRVEMAEMITTRDVDKTVSLLRRIYQCVVVDTTCAIGDVNLAFLDASDTIVQIVTYDSTTIRSTVAVADAFRMIGYPASKVRYLVNRADSPGGLGDEEFVRALGRAPEHRVVSDGLLVVRSNNEGIPFVLADPGAQVSRDVLQVGADLMAFAEAAAAAGR